VFLYSSEAALLVAMAANPAVQKVVEESLVTVAKAVEEQLDDEIAKLDMLDDDDLERLRERRLLQMKKQASQRQQWLAQGHGEYQEIFSEKEFFAVAKTSDRVICHFYRENWPCKVVDKHLNILTKQHLETKFVKMNAEKTPFLTEKLKIFMLPTLALVKKGKVVDYVVGFDELGGKDDFSTEELEDRLAKAGVIESAEGKPGRAYAPTAQSKRNVRQCSSSYQDNDSEGD
jgi:hypothetical protein